MTNTPDLRLLQQLKELESQGIEFNAVSDPQVNEAMDPKYCSA